MDRLNVINVKRQCFEGRHQGCERARGMGENMQINQYLIRVSIRKIERTPGTQQ